ncbi:hypothetical protein K2Z83_25910 [Oscillochloris sp. ZM17-4]|nr:hypothetical protein [Oscillochloris sp. ZM17-4]MBX0331091.1 hypothetical protein [Oscillochloris sp. ZM17-4]
MSQRLREHAEQQYAGELEALARQDDRPRPTGWRLSPWAVATYILGGALDDGTVIEPKYIGSRRLIEIASGAEGGVPHHCSLARPPGD